MKRGGFLLMVTVLLSPAWAQDWGSWHELDGKPAPDLSVDRWLNAGDVPPSRKSLEGKVWLLGFFALH